MIYIEHSGTEKSNKLVDELEEYLDVNYGVECVEIISGYDSNITLYTSDMKKIVEFSDYEKVTDIDPFINFIIDN